MDNSPRSSSGFHIKPGAVIGGKYLLVGRLGEGGMGVVWEAVHDTTKRRVALKILSLSRGIDDGQGIQSDLSASIRQKREELIERFQREARSTGVIDAENVIQVFDAGTDDATGRPYMAMELLEGEDLQRLSNRLGPIPPALALRIAAQACIGLSKAHAAGIVHRDIKMANLFLTARGQGRLVLKLLDFGIAKIQLDEIHEMHQTGLTRTGSMLGSPHYMSPEQAQGLRTIDHRTDIWSLGVVLYKSMTGRAPFEADSFGQLILAICSDSPPPIQQVAPWISPQVAEIVHRALRRKPSSRFQSADDMLAAIAPELPDGWNLHDDMVVPISAEQRARLAPRRQSSSSKPPNRSEGATTIKGDGPFAGTQTGVTTSSGAGKRPARAVPGIVVIVGAAGVAAWLAVRKPQPPTTTPTADAIGQAAPSALTGTPGQGSSAIPSAATPAPQSVKVDIHPPNAVALLDGAPAVSEGGALSITGALGSVHEVRLRVGQHERAFQIVIGAQGAVPSSVALDSPVAATGAPPVAVVPPDRRRPSPGGPTGTPKPPPAAAGTPSQGVGVRDTFE